MTTLNIKSSTDAEGQTKTLAVAYTPDSDDAFNFYAWEHGHVTIPDYEVRFDRSHISILNSAAEAGLYDVVAVSSVIYPSLADRYWILAAGSSVGRGYGPVLVSKHISTLSELTGRRVGIAGNTTTGGVLARMYCPEAEFIETPYNTIADAILTGEFDAGVMIHEELVHFPQMGLHRVCDLGQAWTEDTKLPLPVGLNLVKQTVGRETAREIVRACRDSLQWGIDHSEEAMAFAGRFGRGCAAAFVPMFSNEDTICLPDDVRRGLDLLFERVAAMGIGPKLNGYEVIDA